MGSGGGGASAPDYSSMISAAHAQEQHYGTIMNEQLGFAQGAHDTNLPTYQQFTNAALRNQQAAGDFSQSQEALYNKYYAPLQADFVNKVQNFDTPESEQLAAGQAMGAVHDQYQAAGDAAERQLESFGVDPSAGRFAGLDRAVKIGEAGAQAGAGTQAIQNRITTGLGLEATGANIGQSIPGQVTGAINTATGAGAGGVNATTSNYLPYSSALASPLGWGGLSSGALGMQGQFTNMGFQNANSAAQTNLAYQNSALSGIGTAAGIGASLFLAKGGSVPKIDNTASGFPSDAARGSQPTPSRNFPLPRGLHKLSAVPLSMRFDGGGAIPMAGEQVPAGMSPSGGAATDDIPAVVGQSPGGPATSQPVARINAKEFIFPKDVSEWYGAKHLHGLIAKARKDMAAHVQSGGHGAVPVHSMAPSPSAAPHPAIPRAHLAANMHVQPPRGYAHGGMVRSAVQAAPGAGGGGGPAGAINLGGHQAPRPTPYGFGSGAGAVRKAIPGV